MKYKIKILSHDKELQAQKYEVLADKILEAGIDLSLYCNKRGLCGKCFVEIVEGDLPPLDEREGVLLHQRRFGKNFRLACLYKIQSDLALKIPEKSLLKETFILRSGIPTPVTLNPAVKKYYLALKKPELRSPYSLLELLESKLQHQGHFLPLNLLKELPAILEQSQFQVTAVIYDDREILALEPGNTLNKNFGLAIDIGTTTVVVELLDLITGKSLAIQTALNSQMKYGSDVVSRISAATLEPKNLESLRQSIRDTLNQMIHKLLREAPASSDHVYEAVAAGNTSMNHLFLGLPVKTLSVAPFSPVFTSLPAQSVSDLDLEIHQNGKVYIVPNIKSFVGGDIAAGMIASNLDSQKGNFLFIDLGTNGEIVLKKEDELVATSTAAGPAFEGMNLSCGMLALPGAIYKAQKKKKLVISTIDHKPALGVCGTGLIDLLSIFLEEGKISPKGTIASKSKRIPIARSLALSQKDVREMQLAIAAIKSGIKLILKEHDLKVSDLDGIFLAGAFGNYLNIQNSMKIGLLPEIDRRKVIFIGNSSLAGARAILLSQAARKKVESLVKKIRHFPLAANPLFQEYFIQALEFKNYSV
jgi:uncharacterized 2Fe-2S/4Fe-4S cluster protein (DUF4445 family)